MSTVYRYIILRLAPDFMRGEVVNVGIALFNEPAEPKVLSMAALQKLRAIDARWDEKRVLEWTQHIQRLISKCDSVESATRLLSSLGFCSDGEPGMFTADSPSRLQEQISEVRDLYIAPKGQTQKTARRERRPRLVSELRAQFKHQQILGKSVDDLANHLVVPSVPVPGYPDLKNDFVYKNGVYRITQTLDYRVSVTGAHAKITEVCTKSVAAQMSRKVWGDNTIKLAVVHVPEEVSDIADGHLDMLLAHGFSVFHATKKQDLADYYHALTGVDSDAGLILAKHRI